MGKNWNDIHTGSRKYLSADTFEEWLMEKHEITKEKYEGLSCGRKDLLENEYRDDMDFASFTSGDWVEEDGRNKKSNGDCHKDNTGIKKYLFLLCYVHVRFLLGIFIFALFIGMRFVSRLEEIIQYKEEPEQKEEDYFSYQQEELRENTFKDTLFYSGLVPGKKYTVTVELMGKSTGEILTDEAGSPITVRKTFVPESPNGMVDIIIPLPETTEDIITFERVQESDNPGASG